MQGRPGYSPCEIPELLLLGLVFGIGWHVKVAVYSQQGEEEHWRMHVSHASIVAQCASCLARYCVLETGSSRTMYNKREASTHEVVISNLFHAETPSCEMPLSRQLPFIMSHSPSVELGVDTAIPDAVHLQLKSQTSTVDNHLQCKVKIVKLHASCCC